MRFYRRRYGGRSRRRSYRRTYRRRYRSRRGYRRFRRTSGQPTKIFAKLNFQFDGFPAAGAVDIITCRGNSIYDPDAALGGAVATGFNKYMAFYKEFVVFGSKMEFQCINTSNSVLQLYVQPNTDSSGPATPGAFWGQKYVKGYVLSPVSNSNNQKTVKQYMSTKTMFGVTKKEVMNDDLYAGNQTNNPTNQFFWHILIYNPAAAAVTKAYRIKLTYYCMFRKLWTLI